MDLFVLVKPPPQLFYFALCRLVVTLVRSSWSKARSGEFLANVYARLFLNRLRHRFTKNATLPTEDDPSLIDNTIVLGYGFEPFLNDGLERKAIGSTLYPAIETSETKSKSRSGKKRPVE